MTSESTLELRELLVHQVRELLARSNRIARRSAILVDSSRHARDGETLVAHCAWCGKVRVGGTWASPAELPGFLAHLLEDRRTHSICPSCLEEVKGGIRDAPLPATAVLIGTSGPIAAERLTRRLTGYAVRDRPGFGLEVKLPDPGGAAVNAFLSTVSQCLSENALGPVTVELSDRMYVLGA